MLVISKKPTLESAFPGGAHDRPLKCAAPRASGLMNKARPGGRGAGGLLVPVERRRGPPWVVALGFTTRRTAGQQKSRETRAHALHAYGADAGGGPPSRCAWFASRTRAAASSYRNER